MEEKELLREGRMDPNDVKPAPGPLRVVQEFVNTRSNLRGRDLREGAGGTRRRPAGLWRVVQEFMNTRSSLRGSDLLEASEGTARWLAGHGLFPDGVAEVSEADRRPLTSFRAGLRRGPAGPNAGAALRR